MATSNKRLISLDVLRGITVAGMILVNNSGGQYAYAPLKHAEWNGLTPCDLVFPFFIFMVGISTYISLNKFNFKISWDVTRKILKRTILIFLIGFLITWFAHICKGDFFPFAHIRVLGVLPRIAICYCIASFIALLMNHRYLLPLIIGLLGIYTIILVIGNGYQCSDINILTIIDRGILGNAHVYVKSPVDPEGLTSTISAIAHTLIGLYCGKLIVKSDQTEKKVIELFVFGFTSMVIGLLLIDVLPLNKRIWSPTFVLTTCGFCAMLLAALMNFIDIRKKNKWCTFFLIFGVNPLFLYVLSEVLAIVFNNFGIRNVIFEILVLMFTDLYISSTVYAILFTLLLGASGYPLYRRKIYIKL